VHKTLIISYGESLKAMYVFIRSSLRSDKNACCEGLIDRNTEAPPKKGSW